ncbi:MAG: hypothetical protein RBR22_08070 [Desulfuromonas sp.]|nr:hypothetical protein [Desulfuromonas sp.]
MNALTEQKPGFSLAPQSLDEAIRFAEILSKSDIVPKDFKGSPGNILVAIQWGLELGLQPMQAMQNIAVINGRPSLWGDAVIGIVRGSSLCEYIYENDDGETATCRVKRRGEEEQVRTFSMTDAKAAGLSGKQGPWSQYPKRMRQMRARAFALRDVFPDVLRGMPVAEELMDLPAKDMGDVKRSQTSAHAVERLASLPAYSDESLLINLPKWEAAVAGEKTTPERIISMIESKHTLSNAQRETILNINAELAIEEQAHENS